MIELITLYSGSTGNSTLVRTESAAVLVDAGLNCKALTSALDLLGMSLSDISAIFITHEHSDHISALDVTMRKRQIPIHVTSLSAPQLCKMPSAAHCAVIHRGVYYEERIGDMTLRSFPLPHDSAAHVGYTIRCDDGDRAAVATDMGHITDEALANLSGCRSCVIEANHDIEMLKNGPYPYYLKQRIISPIGHLSNNDSAKLCTYLADSGTENIMLAHLSQENNTPDRAMHAVRCALDESGHADTVLKVAPRRCVLAL